MSIFTFLSVMFFVIGFAFCYSLWLRPLLRSRPSLKDFYARSDSIWKTIWLKVAFLKTKLLAGFLMMASGLIGAYDFIMPHLLTISTTAGIDWEPLTSKVPSYAWPIVSFCMAGLFYWLRNVTAKEHEQVIAQVQEGGPVAQAMMLVATEPAASLPRSDTIKGD